MNEDNFLARGKNEIGLPGKNRAMQGVSISEPVEQAANEKLRRSVFPFDGSHTEAALLGSKIVGHVSEVSFFVLTSFSLNFFDNQSKTARCSS